MCRGFRLILLGLPLPAATAYIDATHPSKAMGESRHYRLFPPPDYEGSGKRYPAIFNWSEFGVDV